MEDATWDGMSESSFELVEAPDARVISSPDLSPAPSLHEDGFEALEAGSPCSSSGGATAVLERSLCFTAMEVRRGPHSFVPHSSRGNPRAHTCALCTAGRGHCGGSCVCQQQGQQHGWVPR
jgi:hypothetical protein